jgi:hypothetical protein
MTYRRIDTSICQYRTASVGSALLHNVTRARFRFRPGVPTLCVEKKNFEVFIGAVPDDHVLVN